MPAPTLPNGHQWFAAALYPAGEPGDVVIIGDELERYLALSFEPQKKRP